MNFFKKKNFYVIVMALIAFAIASPNQQAYAQQTADKIISIIGRNRIILQSDIEIQFAQARLQNPDISDSVKCLILKEMILKKVFMEQADRDSITVTEEDVEGQLENRLRYFIQMYGSQEKLEQMAGKTVFELKEEYRDVIKDEMLSERVTSQILESVKITPAEVEKFYNKIPVDSLPFFPATVEVGQIVVDPPVSKEMDDHAHSTIEKLREQIIEGRFSFEAAAGLYSEDPGSRDNGGKIDGVTRDGGFVQPFVAATFKLQNGEISPIVKTQFGYHIIQMIKRKGDEADVRHILIKPKVTSGDFNKSIEKLDSIRNLLVTGKMDFPEAVGKFSTDDAAKRTGGMIMDPSTGNSDLDITKLDPVMVLLLDTLKPGGYSAPHVFVNEQREKSCRIVFLKTRTTPHKANLQEDYGKIQVVALQQKKQMRIEEWMQQHLHTFYLWIAPEYRTCDGLKDWVVEAD